MQVLCSSGSFEADIASAWKALSSRIEKLRSSIQAAGRSSNIHFHLLDGVSMAEAWENSGLSPRPHSAISILGVFESFKHLPHCAAPWSGREYEAVYHSCVNIVKKVETHAIVVEPMTSQAIDACRSLGLKFVTLSPISSRVSLITIFRVASSYTEN